MLLLILHAHLSIDDQRWGSSPPFLLLLLCSWCCQCLHYCICNQQNWDRCDRLLWYTVSKSWSTSSIIRVDFFSSLWLRMTKTPWRSTVGAAAVDASGVDSFTVGGDLLDDIVCQAQLCVCILHTYHPYNIHIHNNQVVHQTQSNFQDLTQMCTEYLKGCYAFFLPPLFAPFILCILVCVCV